MQVSQKLLKSNDSPVLEPGLKLSQAFEQIKSFKALNHDAIKD